MKGDSYASPDVPKLLQVLSHLTYYCERSVWNDIIILIHNEKKKGFFKFLCGVREVHVGLSDNYSFSKIDISSLVRELLKKKAYQEMLRRYRRNWSK